MLVSQSIMSNLTLTKIFTDILIDIVFFPFWWYSFGLLKTAKKLIYFVADKEKSLALTVWIKNIFTPMYGQRDIQGFLISFFVRLAQIIFRSFILIFWVIVALIGFWLWLIIPALVIYQIIRQLL
jgi:hypothetical protein